MLLMALMLATPQPVPLERRIADWCSVNAQGSEQACQDRQGRALRRFLSARRDLRDPTQQATARCLSEGAAAPSVDWTVAARCLRNTRAFQLAGAFGPTSLPGVNPAPPSPWTPILPQMGD